MGWILGSSTAPTSPVLAHATPIHDISPASRMILSRSKPAAPFFGVHLHQIKLAALNSLTHLLLPPSTQSMYAATCFMVSVDCLVHLFFSKTEKKKVWL